jgi:cytoskeletal protein CcmA (bactofilin family)
MKRCLPLLCVLALFATAAPASAAQAGGSDQAVVVITGDVVVSPGDNVDGVVVVNGDVRIAGRVDGSVVVINGTTTVSGTVNGDLVTVAGPARVLPGARIDGDVQYGDEKPVIAPGATVTGDVKHEGWNDAAGVFALVGALALWVAMTVSTLILGLLLLVAAPQAADAVLRQAREQPWFAVAIGVAVLIALPLVGVVAGATLIGLPLGIALLMAMIPLGAVGYVTSAWLLGRRIVGPPRHRFVAFFAGWGILRGLALIPAFGFLVAFVAVLFGVGALGLALGAARRDVEDPLPA